MNKTIAVLMLGTMLVTSTMSGGVALAQSADADQYPFCRALDLPPPPEDPQPGAAAPPAAAPAAAAATPATAAATAAPATAAPATAAATPAAPATAPASTAAAVAPPAPPPPPTIDELLKSTTDVNKVVDTLLDAYAPFQPADYDKLFGMVVAQIQATYVDPNRVAVIASLPRKYRGRIKSREDLDKALYVVAKTVGDSSTVYLSAPDLLSLELKAAVLKVAFFGLHLKAVDDGSYQVTSIVPGSTADLGGFRVGDTLVSVNGKALKDLSKTDAEGLELNPIGNQLQVVSLQDGKQIDRSYMLQANVPYKPAMQVLPGQVGYVKFPTQISAKVTNAVVQNLVKMQMTTPGGMAGIVLDLRYVDSATVSSIRGLLPVLIAQGVVLHEQVRSDGGAVLQNTTDSVLPMPPYARAMYTSDQLVALDALRTIPLVIVVNGSTTAPGAEQLAVALRNGRPNTSIVGEHIQGNGVEASTFMLPNCGSFSVTTKRYTTADGKFLGDVGIDPDYPIAPARSQEEGDVQLGKAVQVVKSKTAYRPANLVQTDATFIPALGPAPKPAEPLVDVDLQRVAHEYKTMILQGLVLVALLMCPVLLILITRKGTGGGGDGGTPGTGGRARRTAGGAEKKGRGKAFWRRLTSWRASKGASPASEAAATTPATMTASTPPDTPTVKLVPITLPPSAAANPVKKNFWTEFKLPGLPRLVSRTTISEIEMTTKASGFFSHIAVRSTLGALFLIGGLGGLFFYAQSNGGFQGFGSASSLTYMNQANMKDLINLKQVSKGNFSAGVDKPVLVVECPKEACEDEDLALAGVAEDLKETAVIIALDPYTESKVAASFEKAFVGPAVAQSTVMQMAAGYLQSQKQPVNEQTVQALMQNPQFMAAAQSKVATVSVLQPVYPKFFLFSAKDFQLIVAGAGLPDKDSVEGFVTSGLAQLKAAEDAAAAPPEAAAPAAAAPAAAAPAPTPTVAPATPTPTPAATTAVTPPAVPATAPATAAVAAPAPQAGKQP